MRGRRIRVLAGSVIFLVFAVWLTSCALKPGESSSLVAPDEQERLVIYTELPETVYEPLVQEFENRTGIWTEIKTGSVLTYLEELLSGGASEADLVMGFQSDCAEAYDSLFSPYVSALLSDYKEEEEDWEEYWTPFALGTMVIIYNSKLVSQRPPVGWSSILNPAWSGKTAFPDPLTNNTGYTALQMMASDIDCSWEELLCILSQMLEGQVFTDSEELVLSVANGRNCIGVVSEEYALRAVKDGYDVKVVYPEETVYVPNNAAILAGCKHEENAGAFIDFLLSADVQNHLYEKFSLHPVSASAREEDEEFFADAAVRTQMGDRTEVLALWKELWEVTS